LDPTHPGDVRLDEEYDLKQILGTGLIRHWNIIFVYILKGSFGEVRLGIQKKTGMRVAIKLVDRNKILVDPFEH
jgi:serine/threonine protein kinase